MPLGKLVRFPSWAKAPGPRQGMGMYAVGPLGRCKAGLIHRHLMSPHARFHARSQHLFQVLSLSTESNFHCLFAWAVTAIHHFFCCNFMQCFASTDPCANIPFISYFFVPLTWDSELMWGLSTKLNPKFNSYPGLATVSYNVKLKYTFGPGWG